MYYVLDKQNGHMMSIFNDQLQDIDCDVQIKPCNLAQLNQMITTLEQKRQGFNDSSVSDKTDVAGNNRLQYPSTPKDFKSFDSLKELQYNGNMLTPEDHTKVILEMAEVIQSFLGIYFNPEMSEKYQSNIRYIRYYTNIIRQIDIFAGRPTQAHKTQVFHWFQHHHTYPTCMNWDTVM